MNGAGLSVCEFWQLLLNLARARIQSGVVSERGLARQAGLSQPHLHNVLKGIRELSPQSADRLLQALDLTVPQVLWSGASLEVSEVRPVPVLRGNIGPGGPASLENLAGYIPFPARIVSRVIEPVAAWLAADIVLPAELKAGDLVLLDRNPEHRVHPAESRCWVVAETSGLRVRYVRRVRGEIEISGKRDWSRFGLCHDVSLDERNILDIVRAGIVWIGREMETSPSEHAGPARQGD